MPRTLSIGRALVRKDGERDPVGLVHQSAASPKRLTRVQRRLIENCVVIASDDPQSLLFQHTVFCQVGLPYRDPGDAAREWDRSQGIIHMQVEAGKALCLETGKWVKLGLPWGPKPRLILAHLNAEALKHQAPEIEVGDSLTSFVKRIRGFEHGREIRMFKDQLARLSAAHVHMAYGVDGRGVQINTQIVTAFDLWFPKDERQRVFWPSTVKLSYEYFESLRKHAVPLDERALAALAHSAVAIDVYSWLAQRLHRVHPSQPQFIPWTALHQQFGFGYHRLRAFRERFSAVLNAVLSQYRAARVELDGRGMTLRNSPPPVKGRMASTTPPPRNPEGRAHGTSLLSTKPSN